MRYSDYRSYSSLLHYGVFRKFQKQLLGACIPELYCGFCVLATTLNLDNRSYTETLVLDHVTLMQADVAYR